MRRLVVTTAANDNAAIEDEAQKLSHELNGVYVRRSGRSIKSILTTAAADRLLIVRRDRYSLHDLSGNEYQFHPNLVIVRAMNYKKTGSDHFLEAADLREGDKVIDCTVGFATEALLASLQVGETGEVVGLESVPELAVVTREGTRKYTLIQKGLEAALRRIVVLNWDYREYLARCLTSSADVVYFDPFFDETLEKSAQSIGALAAFGNRAPLDSRSILEAQRVARRSVIIKHPKSCRLPKETEDLVVREVSGRKSPVTFAVIASLRSR